MGDVMAKKKVLDVSEEEKKDLADAEKLKKWMVKYASTNNKGFQGVFEEILKFRESQDKKERDIYDTFCYLPDEHFLPIRQYIEDNYGGIDEENVSTEI